MKELDEIISAISETTHIPKWDILLGKQRHAITAHKFLCHIVVNSYPHLMRKLSEVADKVNESIRKSSTDMDRRILSDRDLRAIMNRIRRSLSLPIIKISDKVKSSCISDTKRMFGFDYTDKDIIRRHNAIKSAAQYMDKLCSVERQPLDVGMVFTKVSPKRSYDSWYQD